MYPFIESEWHFERSSGYAGWRNSVTGDWIYDEKYQRLKGNQVQKFTVIYSNYFMSGSHQHSIVSFLRIQCASNEISTTLAQYDVDPSRVHFVFDGWSKMDGEVTEPCESKKR